MKSLTIPMALLCAMALPGAAQDASESATKSKIAALEGAWNQAYKSGDKQALDELLDDAIVLVNDDGSVDEGRILGECEGTSSTSRFSGAAGCAGVDVGPRIREYGDCHWNISGQGNTKREILCTAGAVYRYMDPQ